MRKLKTIFIHCSASDNPDHDNIETIRSWHVEGNGWSDIGYHSFINKKGEAFAGRSIEKRGAGVKGHNSDSIHICISGFLIFKDAQFDTCVKEIEWLIEQYGPLDVVPHRTMADKECPVFDMMEIYKRLK